MTCTINDQLHTIRELFHEHLHLTVLVLKPHRHNCSSCIFQTKPGQLHIRMMVIEDSLKVSTSVRDCSCISQASITNGSEIQNANRLLLHALHVDKSDFWLSKDPAQNNWYLISLKNRTFNWWSPSKEPLKHVDGSNCFWVYPTTKESKSLAPSLTTVFQKL